MTNKVQELENGIRIDIEGNWFYKGAQIVNRNIFLLFCNGLENDGKGGYLLRVDKETSPVMVESTPFVVVDAAKDEDVLKIQLNDETVETLDTGSFFIDKNNVPFCRVKGGQFSARFLRKAYYRIAECFEQDEEGRFYFQRGDEKIYIKSRN